MAGGGRKEGGGGPRGCVRREDGASGVGGDGHGKGGGGWAEERR